MRPGSPAAITCGVASPPMMCIHGHMKEIIVMNHPLSSALRRLRDLWGVDVLFFRAVPGHAMHSPRREFMSIYLRCVLFVFSCVHVVRELL